MKKDKKPPKEKTMYFFPWALMLGAAAVLVSIPVTGGYSAALDCISMVCRYVSSIYALMLAADWYKRVIEKKAVEPPKPKKARRLIKKRGRGKTETENTGQEPAAAPEKDTAKAEKRRKTNLKILEILYPVSMLALLARFVVYLFAELGFTERSMSGQSGFTAAGLCAAAAVLFFTASAMMRSKPEKPGSETARILLLYVAVLSAMFAAALILSSTLNFKLHTPLNWIVRIYGAALALALFTGLLAVVIKKQTLTDFDYFAILQVSAKKDGKRMSPADFLEEHTGLSVKSLWSIRYAASILPAAVLGLAAVLLLSTCVYKVEPYQQAAVYRFGALTEDKIIGEGIHFKAPWPIDKTELYDVKRVKELSIGYEEAVSTDNLWTQAHSGEEYKLLLGGGNELVSVNIKLSCVTDDLYSYLTKYSNPEDMLSAKAYELILDKTITSDLNTVLSVDRSSLADELAEKLNEFCKASGLGIHVNQALIESIHPPIDIADVYQGVVSAGVRKNTLVTNAQADALQKTAEAEKEANTAIKEAEARSLTRISEAQAELDVFLAASKAYKARPDAVTLSKYLDTFETVAANRKVYVFIGGYDPQNYIFNFNNTAVFGASGTEAAAAADTIVGPVLPEEESSAVR